MGMQEGSPPACACTLQMCSRDRWEANSDLFPPLLLCLLLLWALLYHTVFHTEPVSLETYMLGAMRSQRANEGGQE